MTGSGNLRKGYVDTRDGQVHYLEAGSGYPVVFLHMTADAASQWEQVLPEMATRGYRALALDIPGHGNSFRPATPPGGADYARWIVDALAGLHLRRLTLLGHHFGAMVGAHVAVQEPARIDRFCAYGWPRHDAALRAQRRAMPGRTFDRAGEMVKDVWVKRWDMSGMLLPPGEADRFSEALAIRTMIAKMQAGKTWNWAYHAIGEADPLALAAQIHCPVLLFAGPRDHNYQESIDAVGDFRRAEFVPMTWVGVDAPDEDPGAFARIVAEFIERTSV